MHASDDSILPCAPQEQGGRVHYANIKRVQWQTPQHTNLLQQAHALVVQLKLVLSRKVPGPVHTTQVHP